jgi:hypothetical protein
MSTPIITNSKKEAEAKSDLIRKNLFKETPAKLLGAQSHVNLSNFDWNDPIFVGKMKALGQLLHTLPRGMANIKPRVK